MRFFTNQLPDYVPGSSVAIDRSRWASVILKALDSIVRHMPPTLDNCDGGLYVGCAGVGYAFYHVSACDVFADRRGELLNNAKTYIDVALGCTTSKRSRDPQTAFLLGSAGVYVVGSLINSAMGQSGMAGDLVKRFKGLAPALQPVNFARSGSDELFVGRAGYICGALELGKHFKNEGLFVEETSALCKSMIQSGRDYSHKHRSHSPLMYAYYDTEYLGAAHGLSSILQMLLSCPHFLSSDPSAHQYVRASVDFMLALMQSNGNIPPAMDEVESSQRGAEDELVHWCHGGPGIVYLFAKAYLVYRDDKYLDACLRCGELTWRCGLLRKGPGICHGVSGSGYVFLLLYRLTGDPRHLHRALQFAEFMETSEFKAKARTPDSPYSLYEGLAGTVCFLTDLMQPNVAKFPFFDVFP